ncbi:signal transduction histidine kinase LytS [Striga asiatica]|uniref:Signal transduction histidine kinase LytS n=1 Tax=Striga asiatica TaxID=4170 RepID=A0A5A7QS78_STRAF|nr:signal transduction histidine kinase LytS [Striga asiatica]
MNRSKEDFMLEDEVARSRVDVIETWEYDAWDLCYSWKPACMKQEGRPEIELSIKHLMRGILSPLSNPLQVVSAFLTSNFGFRVAHYRVGRPSQMQVARRTGLRPIPFSIPLR